MHFDGATLAEGRKKIKVPQTIKVFCKGVGGSLIDK